MAVVAAGNSDEEVCLARGKPLIVTSLLIASGSGCGADAAPSTEGPNPLVNTGGSGGFAGSAGSAGKASGGALAVGGGGSSSGGAAATGGAIGGGFATGGVAAVGGSSVVGGASGAPAGARFP